MLPNRKPTVHFHDGTYLGILRKARDLTDAKWGRECYCHKHDSHVTQESHHIWPLGLDGPDISNNRVLICSNAHGAVHRCLTLMIQSRSFILPPTIQQQYGRNVRYLAALGFNGVITHELSPHPLPVVPPDDFARIFQKRHRALMSRPIRLNS